MDSFGKTDSFPPEEAWIAFKKQLAATTFNPTIILMPAETWAMLLDGISYVGIHGDGASSDHFRRG